MSANTFLLELESNDTIFQANFTGLAGSGSVLIFGEIGNNFNLFPFLANDVDLYSLQLNAGDRLLADIDAFVLGSGLDSILTVFDSTGNVLIQRDGDGFSIFDSFIDFTASFTDFYYVGVSSFSNSSYSPFIEGSGVGNSTGIYGLTLEVNPFFGRLDETLDFDPVQYLASHEDLIVAFGLNPVLAQQHYEQFGLAEERSADSFDEVQYLASHGDLIAAFGTNFAAATEHYVSFGAAEGRSTDLFDPTLYLSSNPDLRAAFGNNLFAATEHYIQFGFLEGRSFSVIEGAEPNDTIPQAISTGLVGSGGIRFSGTVGNNFNLFPFIGNDVDLYSLQLNVGDRLLADIDALVLGSGLDSILTVFDSTGALVAQNDDANSFLLDSFIDFTASFTDTYYVGVSSFSNFSYNPFIEGSGVGSSAGFYDLTLQVNSGSASPVDDLLGFDPVQYLASHEDLLTAFGLDPTRAREHYEQFGLVEGRSADSFDEVRYLASNGDLIAAFGANFVAATEHYVGFGIAEGRSTDSFNPVSYLDNNPDLQAVFGGNLFAATVHYIQFGFFEGRVI